MQNENDYLQWDIIKNKLKFMYPSLTKSDLIWRHSTKRELFEMIASKLRKTSQELQEEVEKFQPDLLTQPTVN
jgi:hypothetical protein